MYLTFAWYIFINVVAIWLNYNALYIIESLWMKLEIRSFLSKHWSLISTIMPQFRVKRAMQHARVCIINAMRVRTIAITTAIILETGKITRFWCIVKMTLFYYLENIKWKLPSVEKNVNYCLMINITVWWDLY